MQILNSQINQIVDFSAILQAKYINLDCTDFFLVETFLKMKDLFQQQALYKNISIKTHIDKEIARESIFNDPKRLENIMIDLIQNALKYCNTGEISIVAASDHTDPGLIKVSICNTTTDSQTTNFINSLEKIMSMSPDSKEKVALKSMSKKDATTHSLYGGSFSPRSFLIAVIRFLDSWISSATPFFRSI